MRIEPYNVSCLPANEASIRLLERCNFRREGVARAYLRINRLWQDHLLYALLESDPVALKLPRR